MAAGERRIEAKLTSRPDGEAASANIIKRIAELGDWREKPSRMSVSSSTMSTPTSRRQIIRAAVATNAAVRAQRAAKKK